MFNAAVLIPITTTIFLFGCFYASGMEKIFDWSVFMPFSPSWQSKKDLIYFFYVDSDPSEIRQQLLNLEQLYIKEALDDNRGQEQLSRAAKELGITPEMLSQKLKTIRNIDEK